MRETSSVVYPEWDALDDLRLAGHLARLERVWRTGAPAARDEDAVALEIAILAGRAEMRRRNFGPRSIQVASRAVGYEI